MHFNNHIDNHVVIDNDKHFIIDQESKTIKIPEGMTTKKRLVERDHNSERFTFELDRYVEGHDMLECDAIRVQYINSSRDGSNTSTGVYEVSDVYFDAENNKIIFTWLISRAATKYEGTTAFNIVFICYGEEASVVYSWATEIFKKVQILANINAEGSEEEYIDILEQWRQEFEQDIQSKRTKYAIQRVADYLYTVEYDELDYEEGMAYFLNRFNPELGACSSVRNKNFYGRDYDWYYDNKATLVVKRKGTKGKYANVGVVSSYILDEMAKEGNYDRLYDVIPFGILDGINEKGVVCNINVVPEMDRKSTTTGTNPGKEDVPMACLVRKILDECATADEAIYKIQNDYNIIAPDIDNLSMEMHYMIGDPNKTYVVEFVDNAPVIIDTFVNDKPIMTNFYLDTFNIVDNVKTGLTLHAQGLERYDILSAYYDSVKSAEQMLDLMRRVNYTKTYNKSLNPFWYSEFYTYWPDHGDFNINSDHAAFKPIIDTFIDNHFPTRDREETPPSTWQTVHTSVYDIEKRKLIISVQESSQTYEFDLEIPGEKIVDDLEKYVTPIFIHPPFNSTARTISNEDKAVIEMLFDDFENSQKYKLFAVEGPYLSYVRVTPIVYDQTTNLRGFRLAWENDYNQTGLYVEIYRSAQTWPVMIRGADLAYAQTDANHRLVSDALIAKWNAVADPIVLETEFDNELTQNDINKLQTVINSPYALASYTFIIEGVEYKLVGTGELDEDYDIEDLEFNDNTGMSSVSVEDGILTQEFTEYQTVENMTKTIDERSDDYEYPTAKAVRTYVNNATHTVMFKSAAGVILKKYTVENNDTAFFGVDPPKYDGSEEKAQRFLTWSEDITEPITEDTVFRAIYEDLEFNTMSLTEIAEMAYDNTRHINSSGDFCIYDQNGVERIVFRVGDTKNIILNSSEALQMHIFGFFKETLVTGDLAPITVGLKKIKYNSVMCQGSLNGSWENSYLRNVVVSASYNNYPVELKKIIKEVYKNTLSINDGTITTTVDKIWIPSVTELGYNNTTYLDEGNGYPIFTTDDSRIRSINNEPTIYWTRSMTENGNFVYIDSTGKFDSQTNDSGFNSHGVLYCFCI